MKMPLLNYRRTEIASELLIIMVIIFGLCVGAYVIAGWMGEDLEAKNIALCPSDETIYEPEPNEPIDAQIAERDYRAMENAN